VFRTHYARPPKALLNVELWWFCLKRRSTCNSDSDRETLMGSILIADDDKTCRDSIQKVLEREGHIVQTADSVDRAIETLGANHFDLVVCDYRMPGKTGIDLLIELKRKDSTVPVLMISAFADAGVEAAVKRLGGLDVLKKPIRRQELVARTAKVIGG
jgi:two-component system nitrogen regulation response regulator NtrX